jgi:drug/metabolite transporter (DMT)-like permease
MYTKHPQSPSSRSRKQLYLILLCYATVYLAWSATYLFIRIAVQTIPPFYVVGLRFLLGGLLFLAIGIISGGFKRFPTVKEVAASVFLGTFLLLGGNGLVTLAERKVDSYLAALVVACTPIGVAFFDWILIRKKISFVGITGILLGVAGVCVLLYNGSSLAVSFSPEVLMLIGGFMSWAFATSLGHRIEVFPNVFVNSGIQMLVVGGASLAVLAFIQPLSPALFSSFSTMSIVGLLYLAIFGSAGFAAYNYLIGHEPAIRVVSYAFVNPLLALFLGLVFAGETATPYLVPGVFLILSGLFAMLYGDIVFKHGLRG